MVSLQCTCICPPIIQIRLAAIDIATFYMISFRYPISDLLLDSGRYDFSFPFHWTRKQFITSDMSWSWSYVRVMAPSFSWRHFTVWLALAAFTEWLSQDHATSIQRSHCPQKQELNNSNQGIEWQESLGIWTVQPIALTLPSFDFALFHETKSTKSYNSVRSFGTSGTHDYSLLELLWGWQ